MTFSHTVGKLRHEDCQRWGRECIWSACKTACMRCRIDSTSLNTQETHVYLKHPLMLNRWTHTNVAVQVRAPLCVTSCVFPSGRTAAGTDFWVLTPTSSHQHFKEGCQDGVTWSHVWTVGLYLRLSFILQRKLNEVVDFAVYYQIQLLFQGAGCSFGEAA